MEGVIEEGSEALDEDGDENVLDLGIIGAGSRVEHYEIAGYTTAISRATQLAENEAAGLLKESVKEEQAAENKLRTIAKTIIKSAPMEQEEEEEGEAPKSKSAKADGLRERQPSSLPSYFSSLIKSIRILGAAWSSTERNVIGGDPFPA